MHWAGVLPERVCTISCTILTGGDILQLYYFVEFEQSFVVAEQVCELGGWGKLPYALAANQAIWTERLDREAFYSGACTINASCMTLARRGGIPQAKSVGSGIDFGQGVPPYMVEKLTQELLVVLMALGWAKLGPLSCGGGFSPEALPTTPPCIFLLLMFVQTSAVQL